MSYRICLLVLSFSIVFSSGYFIRIDLVSCFTVFLIFTLNYLSRCNIISNVMRIPSFTFDLCIQSGNTFYFFLSHIWASLLVIKQIEMIVSVIGGTTKISMVDQILSNKTLNEWGKNNPQIIQYVWCTLANTVIQIKTACDVFSRLFWLWYLI